jgi:Flp pilus assembly protein TadG
VVLRSFARNTVAASATEFAVIAPVLAFLGLGMIDGWTMMSTSLGMHSAVEAGAKYLITGGTTAASAQSVAMSAWASGPSDRAVIVTQACTCAGAASGCSGTCAATSQPPVMSYTIQASGTWTAPFEVSFLPISRTLTETGVVRVR